MESYKGPRNAILLGCLGEAICRKGKSKPGKVGWKRGIRILRDVADLDGGSVESNQRLADLLATDEPELALRYYQAAFKGDPSFAIVTKD